MADTTSSPFTLVRREGNFSEYAVDPSFVTVHVAPPHWSPPAKPLAAPSVHMPEYHEWMGAPKGSAGSQAALECLLHHHDPVEGCAGCAARLLLSLIHDAWSAADDDMAELIWSYSDGYGEPGLVPPQGYDWSGIRDSSPAAIVRMAQVVGIVAPYCPPLVR